MEEKIEQLKKEKRTVKSILTKHLNELAAELSTKTPKKENITERLRDIDKRRTNYWNCWIRFKVCKEKTNKNCWQLPQEMKLMLR